MTARILKASETATETVLVVHLDETRTVRESGDPDPAYVRRWTWPLVDPTKIGETRGERIARIKADARSRVPAELETITAETVSLLTGRAL